MKRGTNETAGGREGSALFMALLATAVVAMLSMALLTTTTSSSKGIRSARRDTSAFYAAEGGINEAVAILQNNGAAGLQAAAYPRGLGGMEYSVSAVYGDLDPTLEDDRIRLLATGTDGNERSSIEMVVRSVPSSFYSFAVFGFEHVTMASNSSVDSYDSATGTYASQVSGGHANDESTVGSNGDIMLSSNTNIYGDAQPGPSQTVSMAAGATVSGSTTAATNLVGFPPIVVPSIAPSGAYTVNGTRTLGPGDLHYTAFSFNSNSRLRLVGPATLVVDDFDQRANTSFTIDATNGPVKIYGTGNFRLRSNSTLSSVAAHARDVSIFLSGDNLTGGHTIELRSNADFVGTIYGPSASLDVASNFHIFGSVMARRMSLSSDAQVHYDEDLLRVHDNGPPTYEKVSWRRLTPQQAAALGAP